MAYTLTAQMCTTTGTGEAKNRALSGVISAPPASSANRMAPPTTGTTLNTISPVGTSQPRFVRRVPVSWGHDWGHD